MYCRAVGGGGVCSRPYFPSFRAVKNTEGETSPGLPGMAWEWKSRTARLRGKGDQSSPISRWSSSPCAQLAGCAVPSRCLVAGRGVEPLPWSLRPDAAGSRPYMPSGCAGRYSGIILIVGFVGFVLCFLRFCSKNFTKYIISENLQFFYMLYFTKFCTIFWRFCSYLSIVPSTCRSARS